MFRFPFSLSRRRLAMVEKQSHLMLLHIWSMLSLYSLKCLFFPVASVCPCFFFWDEEMCAFQIMWLASNFIHLLTRIDFIHLKVYSLLFSNLENLLPIWTIFVHFIFIEVISNFSFFALCGGCSVSLPYVCAVFCFIYARALQLFLRIFRFLNSVSWISYFLEIQLLIIS